VPQTPNKTNYLANDDLIDFDSFNPQDHEFRVAYTKMGKRSTRESKIKDIPPKMRCRRSINRLD
jgi:hypothetical protein